MEIGRLIECFEAMNIMVRLGEQDGVICGELDTWTENAVNMPIFLSPFSLSSFEKYVDNFDVVKEVIEHREKESYKSMWTLEESIDDFTEYRNTLESILFHLLDKQ